MARNGAPLFSAVRRQCRNRSSTRLTPNLQVDTLYRQ
jgi:hypothetical protein